MREHIISEVVTGSIAQEVEITKGDRLLQINGMQIEDVLDYHFYTNDEELTLLIQKPDNEQWEIEIEKDLDEDLGLIFENGMMDEYKSCCNQCIFCFIDQMPKGMRETLYFKDDDSRLSFLQGNYITLTNVKDTDLKRIIAYKMGPINISVHTTNGELRCRMLKNRFAGEILSKIERLYHANIPMNAQIVLCKNINDKEELEATLKDLMCFAPVMESVSIVPVGKTKYREGLHDLETFQKNDAKELLKSVQKWQEICKEKFGIHFVHASDEWYLLADEEIPAQERYDAYPQLENGVGMMRLLSEEFMEALKSTVSDHTKCFKISIATGYLAADFLRDLIDNLKEGFPNIEVLIYPIRNDFFGPQITVSGLLTGQDIIKQLKHVDLGDKLLLPCNVFKNGEEIFLDDMTLLDLKKALQVKVDIVKSDGQHLLECLTKR